MLNKYKNFLILNGASKNTINTYLSKVKIFLKRVKKINQDNVNKFLLTIKLNKAITSYNGYLASLRSYFGFKKLDIKLPKDIKVDKKLPKVISQDYFENTVIPTVREVSKYPYRDTAILYFMFYSGCRVSEVEKVSRKNIDLEKREITITSSKGKSQYKVYFPERIKKVFSVYFGLEAEQINAFNIRTGALQMRFRTLKSYFKDINFHPHLLRASFATMYLENGGDIVYLSQILGHKNLQTTMKYLNINPQKRKEDYDKTIT